MTSEKKINDLEMAMSDVGRTGKLMDSDNQKRGTKTKFVHVNKERICVTGG